MNTIWHMFWTYALFRKKKYLPLAVIGSFLPDMHNFVSIIYSLLTNGINWNSFVKAFVDDTTWFIANIVHSLGFVFFLFLIFLIFKLKNLFPILYAWLFHILLDFSSHVSDAYKYFWPFSNRVFTLGISYWEEYRNSFIFNIINIILFLIFMGYLLIKIKELTKFEYKLFIFFILYLAINSIIMLLSPAPFERPLFLIIPLFVFVIAILKKKKNHHIKDARNK